MRSPAKQRDVVPRIMQHPAENRANRAGARDQDGRIGHRVEIIGTRFARQRHRWRLFDRWPRRLAPLLAALIVLAVWRAHSARSYFRASILTSPSSSSA